LVSIKKVINMFEVDPDFEFEFNTNEDAATIMSYMRHEHDKRNDYSTIIVIISEISAIHEGWCKKFALILLDDCLTREV